MPWARRAINDALATFLGDGADKACENDLPVIPTPMTSNPRTLLRLWPLLLAFGAAHAEQPPADSGPLRPDGLYRSEVQTNPDGTGYISVLRFAADGRVFLTHVVMPARQDRVCEWFRPELEKPHWAKGTSYRIDGGRLTFRTVSLNATTVFDGAIDGGVLRMQLVVPTRQNLTYPLTFQFAACP